MASLSELIQQRLRAYWPLIKSPQTGLLVLTGLAGYSSARCPVTNWPTLLALAGGLFLAISGSTILNMAYDADIDACMKRTSRRPIPTGKVTRLEAAILGVLLTSLGVAWGFALLPRAGWVVLAGAVIDVVVYTVWLKRRTAYAIVFGGLAGGMPALAGRTLALGRLDAIGWLLALAVLLWIPTHIMTFQLRYEDDYRAARVPTFPSSYGADTTRKVIAVSSVGAAVTMTSAAVGIGMDWGYLRLLLVMSVGLLGLAAVGVLRPSVRVNFGIFKYASFFMLGSMLVVMVQGIA
ncbi:MAG: UbiA family prenyltransferase [Chloroflexota bacterium]